MAAPLFNAVEVSVYFGFINAVGSLGRFSQPSDPASVHYAVK